MHRKPLGRPRRLAAIAAVIALIGCVLPWWTVGGANELPAHSGNAFEGAGIIVFIAALAVIAVVTLPYAAGDRPVGIDRWTTYLIVAVAAWLGFAIRVVDLWAIGAFEFRAPADVLLRGPGLWLTVLGLLVLSRAVYEMRAEPGRD